MFQRIKRFTNRSFVRNVAVLASGTAASQAIGMAFSPLITRLYGPSAYGMQGVFLSIASVMVTIAAMAYPAAIVLEKNDSDATTLCRLSLLIGLVMSFLVALALFCVGPEILTLVNSQELIALMYLIPLFMFISVLNEVMSQWLVRWEAFMLSAKITVCQTLLSNSVKAGLGLIYPGVTTLVITNTLSGLMGPLLMFLGACSIAPAVRSKQCQNCDPDATQHGISVLALRYRDFPLLRAPQVLMNAISQSLPILLLAAYYGSTAAGYYSIAMAVLGVPMALLGTSVAQVFYPRFNTAVRDRQNVVSLLTKATLGMATIGILPFAIVVMNGPMLFEFVFGNEWHEAGEYAQWLAVWLFCAFINRPAVSAIPIIRVQGAFLIFEVVSVTLRIVTLYLSFEITRDDTASIAAFSLVGSALNCALIYYVIRVCNDRQAGKAVESL